MYEKFKLVIEILGALALVYLVGDLLYWVITGDTDKPADKFYRWLVGYQKNYHFMASGDIEVTVGRLTRENRKKGWPMPTIELRRGFWRGRTKIHTGTGNWGLREISDGWMGYDDKIGVSLCDKRGLSITAALEMAGRYPSLQAVLDDLEKFRTEKAELEIRILELEKQGHQARYLWAGVEATLQIIESDRQKYRSEPAKRIRLCLGAIQEYGYLEVAPQPDSEMVQSWAKAFRESF